MLLATVLMVFHGQCKPGFSDTAHVLLETDHYMAENCIFDDRQYEQHARRRREIYFSSVEFERLSFGSEENEHRGVRDAHLAGSVEKAPFFDQTGFAAHALTAAPAVTLT